MSGIGLPGWLGIGGAGFGLAWLAAPQGPTASDQIFAQPTSVAIMRLQDSENRVEGTGLGSLTIGYGGATADGVLVDVKRAGSKRTLSCRVLVEPVSDAQTRTAVDCTPPQLADRPAARIGVDAFNMIVREHVAAAIEERPYDVDGVAEKMIALVAVNGPALAASIQPPGR